LTETGVVEWWRKRVWGQKKVGEGRGRDRYKTLGGRGVGSLKTRTDFYQAKEKEAWSMRGGGPCPMEHVPGKGGLAFVHEQHP